MPRAADKSPRFRLFWGRRLERFGFGRFRFGRFRFGFGFVADPFDLDVPVRIRHHDTLCPETVENRETDIALDPGPVPDVADHPTKLEIDGALAEAGQESG